jgi:hypothetical protein
VCAKQQAQEVSKSDQQNQKTKHYLGCEDGPLALLPTLVCERTSLIQHDISVTRHVRRNAEK